MRKYLGIDFSLNSTGITYFDGKEYEFLAFVNSRIKKNATLSEKLEIKTLYFDRKPVPSVEKIGLQAWERIHMENCIINSELLADWLTPLIDPQTDIILENYSYGSHSDTTIQIIEQTMSLKFRLLTNFDISNFWIYPGPSVKMFCGKGNFNKFDIHNCFVVENDKILTKNPVYQNILKNHDNIVKGSHNEVQSPVNDIIDSYYLVKYHLSLTNPNLKNNG
jgi:hypothetical protein